MAERHIAEGETRIRRQEALLYRTVQSGRDTAEAEELLRLMRESLALMHQHRAMILAERAGSAEP